MNCCGMTFGFWRPDAARDRLLARREFGAHGNGAAADDPIAAVWPAQEPRAFGAFLSRLGGRTDKADFDRFMAERRRALNAHG
jgi:hypothetical protein